MVFVSVQTAATGQTAGVFYSQALFEQNGKTKSWTTWRRAAGTRDTVFGTLLDPVTGKFSLLAANSSNEVKIVQRTEWKEGDSNGLSPVISAIARLFPQAYAGVQGLHDFVVTATVPDTQTPGLLDISLLVATGYKKILLAQTSSVVSGAVIPNGGSGFGSTVSFDNGTIAQTFPVGDSKIVSIEGGVFDDIGPIVAAEVAKDGSSGSNGWLFVGGNGGLAVLSKASGAGWDTSTGLSDGLTGLTSGMSFKTVGSYSNVRKLIHDDQYLYVLTSSKLDRIDLTQANVGLGSIAVSTIATKEQIPGVGATGILLDVVISEKLLVLATNAGLFRLANGLDARTASDVDFWPQLATPEAIGPIRQLFAVSKTGRAQDIARKTGGGNLFALSAFRGKNQAQVFRFDVQQVTTGSISDTTIRRIADLFIENIPSYFVNFGLFRNVFATDGALYYGTRSKHQDDIPLVTVLFSTGGVQTGSRFLTNKLIPVDLRDSDLIAAMIQNSATGSWLVGGDLGVRSNE